MPARLHTSGAAVAPWCARRRALPLLTALLSALALAGALAPPARAGAFQQAILQDDLQLLYSGGGQREATLDELQRLGVDTVRAFVSWNGVAPAPTSTTRPRFDSANPAAYNPGEWDRYDDLVRSAVRRGMGVLLTPTGPIPAWASQCRGSVATRRTCSPDPAEFGRFVTAVGARYSGGYQDENGPVLPRVSQWAIWNEPNVAIWMTPQYVRRGGVLIPASAVRYRLLVRAAVGGLRATGHGADAIMAGETGPIRQYGGPQYRRAAAITEFMRAVFCVGSTGGPSRSAALG